jgi:hypothetical protein
MWSISRHGGPGTPIENPLLAAVQPFDHNVRRALYAATNSGSLRRRTWNGCAFNRAASILGREVNQLSDAADAFQLPVQQVNNFVTTWDRLRGSDSHCTELLRDALLTVGLFPVEDARASDRMATSS